MVFIFFFSSRRRHTRFSRDWSSDVCSSDLRPADRRRPGMPAPGGDVRQGGHARRHRAGSGHQTSRRWLRGRPAARRRRRGRPRLAPAGPVGGIAAARAAQGGSVPASHGADPELAIVTARDHPAGASSEPIGGTLLVVAMPTLATRPTGTGPDRLRVLSLAGRAQADGLVVRLADYPI